MKEKAHERPCLNLELTAGASAEATVPAVRGTKAQAVCHCTAAVQCPKKRRQLNITMLCFRISGRHHRAQRKREG
jgi:hypothetical protein